MVEVRPFARRDREQLTRLANVHVATVLPGSYVPAATLLADLEHPLGEYVVGPWVTDVATLVAVERDRVVAGAHLRRYGGDTRVSQSYRDAGEIVWLLCWPDHAGAGEAVMGAAVEHLTRWQVRVQYADGALPSPGVHGVSDSWPHVRRILEAAGFDAGAGRVEVAFAGPTDGIAAPGGPPVAGMSLRRQVGTLGTAFDAVLGDEVVGTFEVDDDLTRGGTNLSASGWADECNHWVRQDLRGRGVGTWLVGHAAAWLKLGGTTRLLTYVAEDADYDRWARYYGRYGLTPVNRTTRGWRRTP